MKTRIYCSSCKKLVAQLENGSQVAAGTTFLCKGCAVDAKKKKPARASKKGADK